jgi:hypothetical protein
MYSVDNGQINSFIFYAFFFILSFALALRFSVFLATGWKTKKKMGRDLWVCSIEDVAVGDVLREALMNKTNLDPDTTLLVIEFAGKVAGMVKRPDDGYPYMTGRDFRQHWQTQLFDYPFQCWTCNCLLESGGFISFEVVPPMSRLAQGHDHNKIKYGFPRSIIRVYYFIGDRDEGSWELMAQLADECGRILYVFYRASCNSSGFSCCGRMWMYVAHHLRDVIRFGMSEESRTRYEAFRLNRPRPRLVIKKPYRSPLDTPLPTPRQPHKRSRHH